MKAKLLTITALLMSQNVYSASGIESKIKKLNWNNIEVIYLEDNRFPTYSMNIYFADGALSETNKPKGLTSAAFTLMDSGTKDLKQSDILERLEFLATNISANVTHEYSMISISGLTKDIDEAIPFICKVATEAEYPQDIVDRELTIAKNQISSLGSNHSALISRIVREESLKGSPYSYPVEGKVKDYSSYAPHLMKEQLNYFFNDVKKRIYLTGPKSALKIEKHLVNNCNFKGKPTDFVREIKDVRNIELKPRFVFVPVANANQAQIAIGRIANQDETNKPVLDDITADFLGGGFSAKLMKELRVKRGLTYSAYAYISHQKQYGRIGISTFTKNETVEEAINVIDKTLADLNRTIDPKEFEDTISGLRGSHPFKFEKNSAFLGALQQLDHLGTDYTPLFNFNEELEKYSMKDVQNRLHKMFNLKQQTIVVLGDKSLEPRLRKLAKKYGAFSVVKYQDYL